MDRATARARFEVFRFFLDDLTRAARTLRSHVPDSFGNCMGCSTTNLRYVHWPCWMHDLASEAFESTGPLPAPRYEGNGSGHPASPPGPRTVLEPTLPLSQVPRRST